MLGNATIFLCSDASRAIRSKHAEDVDRGQIGVGRKSTDTGSSGMCQGKTAAYKEFWAR